MRLMFVHYVIDDRGSAQDMYHYPRAARELGHEVALYGPPNRQSAFNYSLDVETAEAVVFIFEWTTHLQYGDCLDVVRLVSKVPRRRRIVVDCDGAYNDAINVIGDTNHPGPEAAQRWVEVCDSLSDKIYQPTLHPLRSNVRPFFFHGYSSAWEASVDLNVKDFGMIYVGNNWFRWRGLERALRAVEPIRGEVGPIGVVGHGWASRAPWANPGLIRDAYYTDSAYLDQLGVEVLPPVRFDQVIEHMGRGLFNPVIYRPLFDHLRLVTCRTFETPAANTIPIFCQNAAYVEEIYGQEAVELVLPDEHPEHKILDLVRRPEHYASVVAGIRQRFSQEHSYRKRIHDLIRMIED